MLERLKQWDEQLLVFLNNLGLEHYDGFWIFVTQIENWIPLYVFLALLIFYFYKAKNGFIVLASVLLALGITLLLTEVTKDLVARVRPNNVVGFSDFLRILQQPGSNSFFSGHASTSIAISLFVVLALRKFNRWIYLVFLWPLLFMTSRIYVGVHYPSDILVGMLVGAVIAVIMYLVARTILRKVA